MMCLSIGDGVRLVPLLWMLTMPMYGSFLGPEPVLRLSLMMMIHAGVGAALPLGLSFIALYLQVGVLALILSLPVNLLPYALVWLYEKLLLVSEPALLLTEAAEVVRLAMKGSELALAGIEEQPGLIKGSELALAGIAERPGLIKTLILGVTAVSYVVSAVIAVVLYSQGSSALNW
ncbi:Hypp894 [Branchiostoma lanceolatum]|uniref:Hypp894 protein n=1 Tax=Branchiostoma lanceolatum TaxID=7740 RepID=A0A8J9VDR8_BRALA|nr:Hypp894 [Branchiostoma lanceolatum]